jgi:hypothetical protein
MRASSYSSLITIAALYSLASAAVTVLPTDPKIQYFGRVDLTTAAQPRMCYSGIGLSTRFTGTSLAITLSDQGWGDATWVGVYIDSAPEIKLQVPSGATRSQLTAATGLANTTHTLSMVKRNDAIDGYMTFHNLILDDGAALVQPDPRPLRRIESFGNSITAGWYIECPGDSITDADNGCPLNTQDNGFISYPWQLARMLGADCQNDGLGGLAIMDSTGWYMNGIYGLKTTWDKSVTIPGTWVTWDFSRYTPQVVTFAFGANDAHGINFTLQADRDKWKSAYKAILALLRAKYPNAHFILTSYYLSHSPYVDSCNAQIALELNNPLVHAYRMSRGAVNGTSGHPKIQNQKAMARELYNYIQTLNVAWPGGSGTNRGASMQDGRTGWVFSDGCRRVVITKALMAKSDLFTINGKKMPVSGLTGASVLPAGVYVKDVRN